MYTLDLLLTKACNQTCYYCNVFDKTIYKDVHSIEVDIDYLKYVISCFDFNLNIIIGGGEPGLVKNLDVVHSTLRDHKKIKNIRVLSNGLVRQNNYDWLIEEEYFEHLITDISRKKIFKFYDDMDIFMPADKRWKQVIVTTRNIVTSMLENFDHFDQQGMFTDKFWYKVMNPKTHTALTFKDELIQFFNKIGRPNELYGITDADDLKRDLCACYPYMTSVDFESKKFLHCNANSIICDRKELTKSNVDLAVKGQLFTKKSYCDDCYIYNNNLIETIFGRSNVKRHRTIG